MTKLGQHITRDDDLYMLCVVLRCRRRCKRWTFTQNQNNNIFIYTSWTQRSYEI